MKKALAFLVLLAILGAAGAWIWSGRQPAPVITFNGPAFMGARGVVDVSIDAPRGALSALQVTFEQDGKPTTLATLATPGAELKQEGPDRLRVIAPATRKEIAALKSGDAKVTVHAERKVLRGMRTLTADASRSLRVQLEPPRVSVLSTKHYINLGGAEFVVMKVTPADASAGVRVGDITYPAYPGTSIGISDPTVRVAVFALLYDQDLTTPIGVFAKDAAGNLATQSLDYTPFAEGVQAQQHRDQRRVPAARRAGDPAGLARLRVADRATRTISSRPFLKINGDLRKKNAEEIASFAKESAPQMLWRGPFQQLGNSQVEAAFADHRTYMYKGKEIDQQVHLGFDLAVTSSVPVVAANNGKVVHASPSASTATASSSTTASACSRSTRTSRRSTSRSATR